MQLDYLKGKQLLDRYGIRSIDSRYVDSAAAAAKFARGEPIVLKVLSEKALHKSKAGLVKLNLISSAEVKRAYAELEKKAAKWSDMYTIPIASGCIAGESIMGVILAALIAFGVMQ